MEESFSGITFPSSNSTSSSTSSGGSSRQDVIALGYVVGSRITDYSKDYGLKRIPCNSRIGWIADCI